MSRLLRFPESPLLQGEWLVFKRQKGKTCAPIRLEIPIIPEQRRIIDVGTTSDLTFLVNGYGRAFKNAGFGHRFRKWSDEAGLSERSFNGPRKAAAAARLDWMAPTEFEILAITITRPPRG
ncbi:hypothetical protein R5H32_13300 [Defluviimonas sp. D31]|uniref:hypothetical protein n=1 Tax=Defluviimonas sp. D31 TaxID=3083253 RepID=UPI00296EDCB6|nr:hypothetical protein [Defluviimonas sp. D31]MDW4550331.1 hypothetical protein [Defluviimonas sp. D31]